MKDMTQDVLGTYHLKAGHPYDSLPHGSACLPPIKEFSRDYPNKDSENIRIPYGMTVYACICASISSLDLSDFAKLRYD